MSENSLVIILYACGMVAMWLSEDRQEDDGFYAFVLFLFGPLSLLFVLGTQDRDELGLARVTATRIIISVIYGLAVLQWLLGADELW